MKAIKEWQDGEGRESIKKIRKLVINGEFKISKQDE